MRRHCELPVSALPILPMDHEPHTCHPEQREGSAFTAVKKQILHCVQDDMLKVTIPVGFMESCQYRRSQHCSHPLNLACSCRVDQAQRIHHANQLARLVANVWWIQRFAL